jgi:hypothetical protein
MGLADQLLDLTHLLTENCPEVFTESVARRFAVLTRMDPEKVLVIIAIYATKFEELESPWPMIDLLFKHFAAFSTESLVESLSSVLVFLYKRYPDFREARGEPTWKRFLGLLKTKNTRILSTTYCSLCAISPPVAPFTFPMAFIVDHIKRPDLEEPVLSFLLRNPPVSPDIPGLDQLIAELLLIGQRDESAGYILMQMAQHEPLARLLLDDPSWMRRELRNRSNTLSLLLLVANHFGLRHQIVATPETVGFLGDLAEDGRGLFLIAVCQLMRRLPLNQGFLNSLSEHGVLKTYGRAVRKVADDKVTHSALLFYDTLARVGYVRDFDQCCGFLVSTVVENENELGIVAARVALTLAAFPSCMDKFKAKGLDEILGERKENPVMKKLASRFLKLFGKR